MTATDDRPGLPQQGATDAQKVAAWETVAAWTGTYEVKGSMVTYRNIVTRDPSEMVPRNFRTDEFKIEGNRLTTTPKTDQNGRVANPIITKVVRVD